MLKSANPNGMKVNKDLLQNRVVKSYETYTRERKSKQNLSVWGNGASLLIAPYPRC